MKQDTLSADGHSDAELRTDTAKIKRQWKFKGESLGHKPVLYLTKIPKNGWNS